MSSTDTDLVARVLAVNDHKAFGELVRRHQETLRGFLRRMTRGDWHLADDLAQETFLKAWQKLATFRGEARFSTWLLGIAFNEFRRAARGRKGLLALDETGQATEEPADPSGGPDSNLRLDLTEALMLLSSAERAAVVLCCQNGWSHSEAAQALDCPIGTVKTHVLRGREKLKRHLAL